MPAPILSSVRALGVAALALAVVAHVLSFFRVDPAYLLVATYVLFIPLMIVFGTATLASRSIAPIKFPERGRGLIAVTALLLLLGYAGINFAVTLDPRGVPTSTDGHFYLNNHGSLTELTVDEYADAQRRSARGQTGHEMLFLAVGVAILSGVARGRPISLARQNPSRRAPLFEFSPRALPVVTLLTIAWQVVFALLVFFVFPRPPEPIGTIWVVLVLGIVVFNVTRATRWLRRSVPSGTAKDDAR
jgi:hypothetical protein